MRLCIHVPNHKMPKAYSYLTFIEFNVDIFSSSEYKTLS